MVVEECLERGTISQSFLMQLVILYSVPSFMSCEMLTKCSSRCWFWRSNKSNLELFELFLKVWPYATGMKPLPRLKSEPLLSSNDIVLNLHERMSSPPTVLLHPHVESEESTGTGKGTPWELSGSSTPQRSPKGQSSPVLVPASLHERVRQPHKLPTPPTSPSFEQLAQSSHGAAAGMKLRVHADWNRGCELPRVPFHLSSSRSLSHSPYQSPRCFSPQESPGRSPHLSPLRSPSYSSVAGPPRRWRKGKELGKGSFGTVYEAWNMWVLPPFPPKSYLPIPQLSWSCFPC